MNSPRAHFVDIHEVPPEEEAEQVTTTAATNADNRPDSNKRTNRAAKLRDSRRQQRTLSRQVSLETGFSVLNREKNNNNYSNGGGGERKVLSRSGLSFGGFDSAMKGAGGGTEGVMRKADFSLFRTKSTLSKQNSLMKSRKERETVASALHEYTQRNEGFAGNREDESVNRSVPAGRYFAALRGPELDEVKVNIKN